MNSKIIDGTRTLKAVLFAAILSSCAGWTTEAAAEKSFFCRATVDQGGSPQSLPPGPLIYDMGILGSCTDVQYAGLNYNNKCSGPAQSACSKKAAGDANFNSAAFWCAKGVPNGSTIIAYSAVGPPEAALGRGRFKAAQTKVGVLINKPQVTATTCTCPISWEAHEYPAGHKTGRCFQLACGPSAVRPFPEGPIGNDWGFTWGNGSFYAWGNAANGGAPKCETHITSPAECRWQ